MGTGQSAVGLSWCRHMNCDIRRSRRPGALLRASLQLKGWRPSACVIRERQIAAEILDLDLDQPEITVEFLLTGNESLHCVRL